MKILGVSGSPIKDSNTDRALQVALEATGMKTEFIKLSDYDVGPCNACLGCIKTNRCVQKDDGVLLTEKAFKANGLIIAGFTPYSTLDSRTKAFMERLYALRHRHALMAGKPGAAIVTCAIPPDHPDMPPACENGIKAIQNYMMEEGMDFVGGVSILGNVPCVKCGENGQCQASGLKMIFGKDATPDSVGINQFEDDPEIVAALEKIGRDIADKMYV